MYDYVARQAIFNRNKDVFAYELLFRDGKSNTFPDIEPDEATSKLLNNSHLSASLEDITGGKIAFINFYRNTLLYRFPTFLDPNNVVVEVLESVEINEDLINACKHIRELGYTLALDDYDFDPKWEPLLPLVDIIKVDVLQSSKEFIQQNLHKISCLPVKLLAEKIEDEASFQFFHGLGFDYFQGYFLTRPEVIKKPKLPSSKLNLLQLLSVSSTPEFDYDKVNDIIERDVVLSYKLLRFINSPLVNKRHKISSLKHALKFMGELEIKKFISLLMMANINDSKPVELIHISLVRAKFCELISVEKGDSINPPMGFLAGLLSVMDAFLDQKMQTIVNQLPIAESLKSALCGDSSQLNQYLQLIRALEMGDWHSVKTTSLALQVDEECIFEFQQEAMTWGQAMKSAAAN
ncbi:HDOD domain-containing protein [Alteromonadaceae bacterium BrNp21-10]|nr:HDOD domain-containing protein [Alteromonadaceae bacterium BrNp21-10]